MASRPAYSASISELLLQQQLPVLTEVWEAGDNTSYCMFALLYTLRVADWFLSIGCGTYYCRWNRKNTKLAKQITVFGRYDVEFIDKVSLQNHCLGSSISKT